MNWHIGKVKNAVRSDSSARLYQQDVSTKFQKMKKKKKLNSDDFQQKIGA
jgi:hypothetical protein